MQVLKLLVGANISQEQLSHIAERTLLESDKSKDRRISFEEFKEVTIVVKRVTCHNDCVCIMRVP